jgi:hypothetical protein
MIHLPTIQTAIQALQSHDGIGSAEEAIQVLEGLRVEAPTWREIFENVKDEEEV